MDQNNHAYRNLYFLVAIFCFAYFSIACDSKNPETSESRIVAEYLKKPNQEIVALLAVKYNKDLNLIEEIIDIYLTQTDYGYRLYKSTIQKKDIQEAKKSNEFNLFLTRDKSSYAEVILKTSIRFSLDPSVVASILADYRVLKARKSL